jgi:phenylalanyl-tRNA synthetase beta chain
MKVPVSWLREFIKLPNRVTTEELENAFVSLGFEVENIETYGQVQGELLVGEVISIKNLEQFKKPIRFCQVKIGNKIRGIVCGATNFVEGDKVVVAVPGTTLPGNFTITARKTYDHLSDGMICSESELGISDAHSGILVINRSIKSGTDAKKLLGLGETIFELSVLPDRGYALSMRGIAREIAAFFNLKYDDPIKLYKPVKETAGVTRAKISAPKKVAKFVLVTLDGVDPNAPTPEFMKQRLTQMGMRPISLPVDVTNYVMLELGQPLHAFDRKKVKGTISVRFAKGGEKLKTLDGMNRALKESDLVISDQEKALSIAGIMGGAFSEITAETKQIVLEAANFEAATVSQTARRLGLTSEASKRFERGIDPELASAAAKRAALLMTKYGGGRIIGASAKSTPLNKRTIWLSYQQVRDVTGVNIKNPQIVKTLEKIGAKVTQSSTGLRVLIPTWRSDLETPNDLIEEVLRLYGYQHISGVLPTALSGRGLTKEQKIKRQVSGVLAGLGAHEVLNYPFCSEKDFNDCDLLASDRRRQAVRIVNPLNEEVPFLRTFLIPGLLATTQRNVSRGNIDFTLFEQGKIFNQRKKLTKIAPIGVGFPPKKVIQREIDISLPDQSSHLAMLALGNFVSKNWTQHQVEHSWITVTEAVSILLNQLGAAFELKNINTAPWHPGRAAAILVNETSIGVVGQIHPRVSEKYGISSEVFGFEIDLDLLIMQLPQTRKYIEIGKMPYAVEDLALVVNADVNALRIQDAIKRAAGPAIETVNLFDVFAGSQLGEGKKSLAFRMMFRAEDRTLSSGDLAQIRERIVRRLKDDFGAVVRS